ncbi:TIGR02996 domain-containing protein [Pyxidicoccus sp. MSG2]|uniref:TIGR02996 domain-containing protein n=1 Tax=Pyxidicoccus sp. MSG2 TaxID=2996790 RepID=UPI00226DE08E|nr:TIGR02996 domain-containing protein [Pyxidicoccus sp. MSG2]MCY1018149.1 TIGR02996 domain-containing protein [Pyxidicoccus sp. MSG2]
MRAPLRELLGRALGAFECHADEVALGHLLEAWRHSRDARIASLVEGLSERLTRRLSPLDCGPGSESMNWRRPLDLPRLLASLREGADRGYPGSLRRALRGFREWPEDPRFTSVLLEIVRMPIATDVGVPDVLCELLAHVRDPRVLAPLREVHAGLPPGNDFAARLDAVIQRILPKVGPPLDEESTRLCEEWETAFCAREDSEARSGPVREALLARVYADPEDVSARLVLADHLLEQGDPLGEFITQQCAPQPDEARIQDLLKEHQLQWEAPLGASVVRGFVQFERGLPVAVLMDHSRGEPLPEPGPGWSTVREVGWSMATYPGAEVEAWLSHPHLRNVMSLRSLDAEMARGLGSRPLGLSHLDVSGPLVEKAPDLFTRLDGLPRLTHVLVYNAAPEDVRLCATSRLASRLVRFEARGTVAWALIVMVRKQLPVLAKLFSAEGVPPLAHAIQGASGFGIRALHIHVECRLTTSDRRHLQDAASLYERVEWSREGPG